MSRQTVTSGTAPIVWSTIDDAFEKINSNFQELYASVGSIGDVGFDSLESNLIPAQNDTYDLGFPVRQWRKLYLSESLTIGGVSITNEGTTINLPSGTTVDGRLIIDPDKAFFKEFSVNSTTSIVADTFNDTLDFQEGIGIDLATNSSSDAIIISNAGVTSIVAGTATSISGATGAVTINNTGVTSVVAGLGIDVSSATGAVTILNDGIVDIDAGVGISVGARDPVTGKVIVTNTQPAGNAYRIISVSGEPSLTARSSGDTLTLIEGSGINITNTLASGSSTNRVTFENTGVLSLTAGANITLSGSTGNITVSFNNRADIIGSVFADDSTMLVDGTNGRIVGPVFANVTGNVTGNVSGNVTGNIISSNTLATVLNTSASTATFSGNVTGNLTGNVSGYHTGDMTGSVFGQDSSKIIDGVEGKVVGPVDTNYVVASSYIQTATYTNLAAITSAFPIATKGMIVFDDDTNQFRGYDGSSWVALN